MNERDRVLAFANAAHPIAVSIAYVRLIGDIGPAVMLSQVLYWFQSGPSGETRARVERDGELWVAKSLEDWARDLGLVTEDGKPRVKIVRTYMNTLKAGGWIQTGFFKFAGTPVGHVRPNWAALADGLDRLNPTCPNGQVDLPKRASGLAHIGQVDLPTVGKSKSKETETTTEITTTSLVAAVPAGEPALAQPAPLAANGETTTSMAKPARRQRPPDPWKPFNDAFLSRFGLPETVPNLKMAAKVKGVIGYHGFPVEVALDVWQVLLDWVDERPRGRKLHAFNAHEMMGECCLDVYGLPDQEMAI